MNENLKNAMLTKLKTTKDGIIEEWDNGIFVYCPGRKDNWKVAIVIGDGCVSPLMATINYMMSMVRDKIGNDNFSTFYKNIHNIHGDPRAIEIKSQIESVTKSYVTKIEPINLFYKDMTFSRFCILYYSILHSDRHDIYHSYHCQGNFCNHCSFICYENCNFRKRPFNK
jgi:hypothetical protein